MLENLWPVLHVPLFPQLARHWLHNLSSNLLVLLEPVLVQLVRQRHPGVVVDVQFIGSDAMKVGKGNEEALRIYRETLEAQRRALGPGAKATLETMASVASSQVQAPKARKRLPVTLDADNRRRQLLPGMTATVRIDVAL